ncbi:MAG: T9SS C-terminal target domain-containing protein [Bacteroidetes bacterium]|nr:MAG: T9SS C-terminal target domain-containing protein [Bacteroidota bacterium]
MKILSTLLFFFLSFMVLAQNCPEITAQLLGTSCEGAEDGLIDITVSGGVAPYSFQWNTGAMSEDVSGLAPGGYAVTVTDSVGCVTTFPEFNPAEEPLLIPDATGQSLITSFTVNQFEPGALVASGDDFEVCVIMEHSWLRDLEISLVSPDGTQIILHDHPGNFGGEVFMGEPIDGDEGDPTPGVGYLYCWKSTSVAGTILQNIKGDLQTLPAGTYTAFESFANFVGVPLNGDWSLEIEDSWGNDNGFVFDWYLNINGGNVELLTVTESDVDCVECQENFHCMQWLRDTISNNVDLYDWVEKATWEGRTVFLATRGDASDGGFTSFFDCEGNLMQTFIAGFSQTYIPNPPFFTFEDLTEIETIWSQQIALEDCDAALTIEDVSIVDVSCYGGSDGEVCSGAFGGLPPYTLQWQDENGFTLEGSCISNIPAGVYSLVVIDANNTSTEPIEVIISEPEEIVISIELVPDTGNQTCDPYINVSGGVGPFVISWTPEEVIDQVVVDVMDANGCTAQATADCVINSVQDIQGLQFLSISPNPSEGVSFIQIGFETSRYVEMQVRNVTGNVVWSTQVSGQLLDQRIDLSNQPAGMYFVELVTEGGRMVKPLVLSK